MRAAPTLPPAPTLTEALAIVRSGAVATEASKAVQAAIQQRTAGLLPAPPLPGPGASQGSNASAISGGGRSSSAGPTGGRMHRAAVTVPAQVAHLLRQEPQLVAPAVEAFYNRDTAAMKARCLRAGRMLRPERHRLPRNGASASAAPCRCRAAAQLRRATLSRVAAAVPT